MNRQNGVPQNIKKKKPLSFSDAFRRMQGINLMFFRRVQEEHAELEKETQLVVLGLVKMGAVYSNSRKSEIHFYRRLTV